MFLVAITYITLSYITLYLNGSTRHSYLTRYNITYPSVIESKHYVHFKRLLKQLYCFERCLATNKNKICKKENETIKKLKNFWFPSLIDIQMSFAVCLGDIMHD